MLKLLDWNNSTSLHRLPVTGTHREPDLCNLEQVIEYSAQMLPAEGPITGFSFLNPLHAFEHLPFDEAVRVGLRLFGGQPYLSEQQYREKLTQGRIQPMDLQTVLEEDLGKRGWDLIAGLCSRKQLRMALLQHPVFHGSEGELDWHIAENQSLSRLRSDLTHQVRQNLLADTFRWVVRDILNQGSSDGGYHRPGTDDPRRRHILWPLLERFDDRNIDRWSPATWEAFTTQALWRVCEKGLEDIEPPGELPALRIRPRDLLLEATGADSDALVHDVLIRYAAAFADQGFAHWTLPHRELGFYKAFLKLYRQAGAIDRWLIGLAAELARLDEAGVTPLESISQSLGLLGIAKGEWEDFFPGTLLALRGWASMIRQMDVRGDRFPVSAPCGTLTEFLAVRLILERYALAHLAREVLGLRGPLADLRAELQKHLAPKRDNRKARAFLLFELAQLQGWRPSALHALNKSQWRTLVAEIEVFSSLERRRIFQTAFERHYRTRALDALATHTCRPAPVRATPRFQASFCIDAREESFRRHIEELCPDAETFAAAGFYSVPVYFRGIAEAHFNPLCPVIMKPEHWLSEDSVYSLRETERRRAKTRRLFAAASHGIHVGSRSMAWGAILSGGVGVLASIPLVGRVLFPRLAALVQKTASSIMEPPAVTRLLLERMHPERGPDPDKQGFSLEEMTQLAGRVLRDIGLTRGFARIVFLLGHRSDCLNNPHKAAYDCGACTGPGGPNARALAMMLNDPRVRQGLADQGISIPLETVFVSGCHNTTRDRVEFYDLDLLPRSHIADFDFAHGVFEKACERNAHERCRRFSSAPLNLSAKAARRHAEGRAEDLAQVRPEFGNATNALCFVGRRHRTRGLFMDRRAFMHSYDPNQDDAESSILARILSAVIPVCQGINLQYYFSAVDPARWGSGSKLPHNVTSLLGVMDGAASDLRSGLPWQSVEIHEPMRLLFVIETSPDAMLKIMARNAAIDRIIRNQWSQLAVLDPGTNDLLVFRKGEFHRHHSDANDLPRAASSLAWYAGCRHHLEFAAIEPAPDDMPLS
jgi:uncharacterized protein YbcC (UPF0753/DUF2309 family)